MSRCGSNLKYSVERPCGYQGDTLAADGIRPSHESLHEKLQVQGFEVLHWVIDKNALLDDMKSCIPESLLLIWIPPRAE
jgi:hypothetical protein